jgi:cytidylate kinase
MRSIEQIIERQVRAWETEASANRQRALERPLAAQPFLPVHPVITISRETGAGGTALAEAIASRLDYAVFDREIVDRVCAESGFRRRVIESLDEKTRSEVNLWAEGIVFQRLVLSSDYLRILIQVVGSIAELGKVIIVGRGANHILGPTRGVHVRVVAPPSYRIENVMRTRGLTREAAKRSVEQTDAERRAFVRRHFGLQWEDPSAFHLVINTAVSGIDAAADVVQCFLRSWPRPTRQTG